MLGKEMDLRPGMRRGNEDNKLYREAAGKCDRENPQALRTLERQDSPITPAN